jgi:hypothetical protein
MNAKQKKECVSKMPRLFDASESFERALIQSRIERGEPGEGLKRTVWESENWVSANPVKFSGILLALGGILGLSAWILRKDDF